MYSHTESELDIGIFHGFWELKFLEQRVLKFRTFMWLCGAVYGINVIGGNVDYSFVQVLSHLEDVNRRFFWKACIYVPYHTGLPTR